jgi:flagellar assembly protein FliH
MSARLIKKGAVGPEENLVPFSFPADGRPRPVAQTSSVIGKLAMRPDDAASEAEKIIAQAKAKAAEIIQEANDNAQQLIAQEVSAEIVRSIDPWRTQLTTTLGEIDVLRSEIAMRSERELVRLAIEIAKKVVHREVTIDNEIVMTLARIGLSRMHNRIAATIHLNPDDLQFVEAHRERLEAGHTLDLVEDRSIGRGGCLLHSEMGDVDARIEQQFAEIERAFLGI